MMVFRWIPDAPPLPRFARLSTFCGNCDRLRDYELSLPAINLHKSIHMPVGTGRYDRKRVEDTFTNISHNPMTQSDDDRRALYSWLPFRKQDLDNQDISEFMSGSARIVFEVDRVVPENGRVGIGHRKIPDIDPGLDAEANQFRLRLNRAIKAEVTGEKPTGEIT